MHAPAGAGGRRSRRPASHRARAPGRGSPPGRGSDVGRAASSGTKRCAARATNERAVAALRGSRHAVRAKAGGEPPRPRPGERLGEVRGADARRAGRRRGRRPSARSARAAPRRRSAGQVHAEEGQVGVGHGVDVRAHEVAAARGAAAGRRRGTGRSAGRPARRGDREAVRPGAGAGRPPLARVAPRACRTAIALPLGASRARPRSR